MGAYRMSGDYMFVEKAIEVANALDPAFERGPLPAAHVRNGFCSLFDNSPLLLVSVVLMRRLISS